MLVELVLLHPKQLGMAFFSSLSACFLFSLCWFYVVESHGEGGGVVVEQREFDYFLLSFQWPGTICQNTKHCCASNGCCRSNSTNLFTIHGLWVNYNDGTWPACCKGAQFDIKQDTVLYLRVEKVTLNEVVSSLGVIPHLANESCFQPPITPLLGGLKKYWPTLSCSSSSTCHGAKGLFWAHEWEKHGTCSAPVFRNEYSYFLATLNLYLKYNITEILVKEGYVPSNSEKYPLGGIVSAIQNAVRATPLIVCSHGAIQELRLCFYKNFEPQDCLNNTGESSCPSYVRLPEHVPQSLGHTTSTQESSIIDAI